jgi:hypothetical protein
VLNRLSCRKLTRIVRWHLLVFVHDLLALLGDVDDGLTSSALRLLLDLLEYLFQELDPTFDVAVMLLERRLQIRVLSGFLQRI